MKKNNNKEIDSKYLSDEDLPEVCSNCGGKIGLFHYGNEGNYCSRKCASEEKG